MSRIPAAWRVVLAGVIVMLAVAVALWPREDSGPDRDDRPGNHPPVPAQIAPELRAASGVADCPQPSGQPSGAGPLAGMSLTCLADGQPVDVGEALAGRPAVLNLWANWCIPCRAELPMFAEFAARAGSAVTVATVHSDPSETKALSMLGALNEELRGRGATELHLPGFQDAEADVRNAAGAPRALPITVLIRADGTIADYKAGPFRDVDDIAGTVAEKLGVTV